MVKEKSWGGRCRVRSRVLGIEVEADRLREMREIRNS